MRIANLKKNVFKTLVSQLSRHILGERDPDKKKEHTYTYEVTEGSVTKYSKFIIKIKFAQLYTDLSGA